MKIILRMLSFFATELLDWVVGISLFLGVLIISIKMKSNLFVGLPLLLIFVFAILFFYWKLIGYRKKFVDLHSKINKNNKDESENNEQAEGVLSKNSNGPKSRQAEGPGRKSE